MRFSEVGYFSLVVLMIFCASLGVLWRESTKGPPNLIDRWELWMLSVVLGAFIIFLPFGLLRSRRLVTTGEITVGRVVDWSPSWSGCDYVTIDFKDLHGAHHRRTGRLVARTTRPEDLTIFYDRDHPRQFVVDGECAWRVADEAPLGQSWTRRGT